MRFQLEKPLAKRDFGKKRTISKFLWFPKRINYEIRWLEEALIEQVVDYRFVRDNDCPSVIYEKYYWKDSRWIDLPIHMR